MNQGSMTSPKSKIVVILLGYPLKGCFFTQKIKAYGIHSGDI